MLNLCKKTNKIPVFYAYVIAFEARAKASLQDCNTGSQNLCIVGAQFIRENDGQYLVKKYAENAIRIERARYFSNRTALLVLFYTLLSSNLKIFENL